VGFPHDTIDIPGAHDELLRELDDLVFPNDLSRELFAGLNNDTATYGHTCATTWVMTPDRSHILLVQHELLGWSAPGGHMYPHETSRQAALRELEEETGIAAHQVSPVVNAPAVIHVSDVPGEHAHRHWNISWFFTTARDVALTTDHGATWWLADQLPTGPTDLAPTIALFASLPLSISELD